MAETKKIIPKRRFKEFQNSEAWEQCNLDDTTDFIDGNYGEKYPKAKEFLSEGIPFFTSAVIGTTGFFNYQNVKYISLEKNKILVKAQSKGGDLILTNRGASMGVIAQIPEKYTVVNIGPQLTRIRGKAEIDNLFLLSMLKTSHNNKKILSLNSGSAMNFVGLDALGKFEYQKPIYDEQVEIGLFFANIDNLITLHQRKLDKIKSTKKAYLYEMFPAEGESKPKRRFKGFTDDWEECKLGDSIKLITYGFTNPMLDTNSGPWKITAKDIVNGQINYSTARHTDKDAFDKLLTLKSKPIFGDVLVTKDGTLGRTAVVNKSQICINQSVALLRCNQVILNPLFLNILLSSKRYQQEMLNDAGGGTIKHIYISKLEKMLIEIPNINEQGQICNLFENVDNLITLHQHKLDKLKNLKKSYLNEMFI